MMFPTPMIQLVAVVLDPDVDAVTKALLDVGVLHFIDIREQIPQAASKLERIEQEVTAGEAAELRKRIEGILSVVHRNPAEETRLSIEHIKTLDLEKARSSLDQITGKISELRNRQSEMQQELLKLEDMRRQLELFGNISAGFGSGSRFSYLSFQTGSLEKESADGLQQELRRYPSVCVETGIEDDTAFLLLISMKRDEKAIDELLERYGWHDVDLSSKLDELDSDVTGSLDKRINEVRSERDKAAEQVSTTINEKSQALSEMWQTLRLNELYATVQSYYARTSRTVLFSGWLPSSKQYIVDGKIRETCGSRCLLEWNRPKEVEAENEEGTAVPVELHNPKFLAPFQLLVQNYSIPEYGTVDPTPFVAIAYLVMFGLMFGDAGHGLILALAGIVGRVLYTKRNNVRKLLTLLIWCGSASIVTGVLFGAYFGMQWFEPIWFDYHGIVSGHGGGRLVGSIYDVLAITIYFGIAVIALGLVLNWINLVSKKRWFELVFSKGGLIGGEIYAAGVIAAHYFVRHDYKQLPDTELLFFFLGIPVLLLALKAPIDHIIKRRRGEAETLHPLSIVDFAMEWIVEILEIFSGYLANTISFMRVAGLGIAHEALMIAFFSIAEMTGTATASGTSYTIWSVLVLLVGNVLVIVLEGLSAGIQSLRLNYYEFFSKYFSGTGRAYKPVSLGTTE